MIEYLRNLLNLRTFQAKSERGASAVEYGLLVAGIAAVIVAVVFTLGGTVKTTFDKTCGAVKSTDGTGTTCATGN